MGAQRRRGAVRLLADKGLKRARGVKRFADQTQLGEWLRGLGPDGVAALRRVLGRVAAEALQLCPAGTVRTGGELEVFFDDTQLEVTGKKIEGVAFNYEGKVGEETPDVRPSTSAFGSVARLLYSQRPLG